MGQALPTYREGDIVRAVSRQEKKFLCDLVAAKKLEVTLGQIMKPDSHNGADGYMIRSLYFDTLHDRDYVEKLFGVHLRRKVRVRIYDPTSDFALLEVKQKEGENQRKRSLPITRQEARRLSSGDYSFLLKRPEPFAQEVHGLLCINGYMPKAIVDYNRKAFVVQENKIRVTLDSNIRATETNLDLFDANLCTYPVFDPFNVVLEVKFDGFLLSYVRDALNQVEKSELAVSKYCLSRASRLAFQF